MPYQVSKSGPQTWEIALNLEHWDIRFLENRSASGFFHQCFVNEGERKRGSHALERKASVDQVKEGVHLARHASPVRKIREVLSSLLC